MFRTGQFCYLYTYHLLIQIFLVNMRGFSKIVLSLLIIFGCFTPSSGQTKNFKELSVEERISSCQLDEEKLVNIKTTELLKSCIDFPFIIDFLSYGATLDGFQLMMEEFNGFNELLSRADVSDVLILCYQNLKEESSKLKTASLNEQGQLSIKYLIIEYLLADSHIIPLLEDRQRNELKNILIENLEFIRNNDQLFGGIHEPIISFLFNQIGLDQEVLDRIEPCDCEYQVYGYYYNTTVNTPKGSTINTALTWYGADLSIAEIERVNNCYQECYPSIEIVGDPTPRYNCHAYAWHLMQGESNYVWINNTGGSNSLSRYWSDGSFIEAMQSNYTHIVYSGDHSALKYNSSKYISKWGAGPLVIHDPNDVPPAYHAENAKLFFRRSFFVSGSRYIDGSSQYSVEGLTSGCVVRWDLTDNYYMSNCLITDYPSANQCMITEDPTVGLPTSTLYANVIRNGIVVGGDHMLVSTQEGFGGTYYNGVRTKPIELPNPLYTDYGGYVLVNSPKLVGATLSYNGSTTPYIWQHNSSAGTLKVGFAPNTGGSIIVNVNYQGAQYYLPILATNIHHNLYVNRSGHNQLSINVDSYETEEAEYLVEIVSPINNRVLYRQSIRGTQNIDISNWGAGAYVIRVTIDGEIITKSIFIQK